MDSTLQTLLAALMGALVAGGAVLAWAVSERQQRHIVPPEEPVVPPGVATVLSVLRSSAVLVGEDDEVLKASAPAYALGLVRGHVLVSEELAALVGQVRRDGQIRETELFIRRQGLSSRHVTARVAPLSSRLVLALVEDRTRERQVEAVRRDFVANVSHELKTPIGALGLLAETMAGEEDGEMLRRLAGRVLHESERLERTVEDLLDLSILEAQESPERELIAVDMLMADAAERMASTAEAAGIPIEMTEPAGDILVACDRRQVTSALFNLLDNAVKYSEEGSKVEFSAQVEGFAVAISVRDHGIGIPHRDLERIFERFYRVDRTRSRATGGTGLGLAIVRHVAQAHQGEVSVESEEGHGSTFTLKLPLAAASRTVRRTRRSATDG